eukprot:CAMPEP_0194292538 /NCGR_PEP_ID=MMETSP0169-20130528/45855_1 /TAXON_ID=218684 /ORGANISM="Corethron pennatum, Strain L29A3" /LENGTH=391 /DNA_ID=CAMNT_0039040741 /DNA_START=38 /DNA_END=1213 /DNA_ORIENTATION=-
MGHPDTETLQSAFDLNDITDRNYDYVLSTNDDGWLVGGGEPGPYKLPAADSSHIEIMHVGTFEESLGGISQESIVDAIESGDILVPQMKIVPTRIRTSWASTPELELLFDMEPAFPTRKVPLPNNWQLRFLSNQLTNYFRFPNQAAPQRYHCSVTRKISFRSLSHRINFFKKCKKALATWKKAGPQPLVGTNSWKYYFNTGGDDDHTDDYTDDLEENYNDTSSSYGDEYASGIWLYSNRANRTRYFRPNFLPPYDTDPAKMQIIDGVLQDRYMARLHIYADARAIYGGIVFMAVGAFLILGFVYRRKYSFSGSRANFCEVFKANRFQATEIPTTTPPMTPTGSPLVPTMAASPVKPITSTPPLFPLMDTRNGKDLKKLKSMSSNLDYERLT